MPLSIRSIIIICCINNTVSAECHPVTPEHLSPPVDIQTSCDLVVWRNAPNISYNDITGYEILLVNSATNEIITDSLDASATFYNLDNLNETLKNYTTSVQVSAYTGYFSHSKLSVAYRFEYFRVSTLDPSVYSCH